MRERRKEGIKCDEREEEEQRGKRDERQDVKRWGANKFDKRGRKNRGRDMKKVTSR